MWRNAINTCRLHARMMHAFYTPDFLQQRIAVQVEKCCGQVVRSVPSLLLLLTLNLQIAVTPGLVEASLDDVDRFERYPSWAIQVRSTRWPIES